MRKIGLSIGVLIILTLVFVKNIRFPTTKTDESMSRPQTTAAITQQQQTARPRTPKVGPKNSETISSQELQKLREALPTLETIKEEAQMNLHHTPVTLINFAKELGPLMEKGLKNSSDAELLSRELQDCALDEEIIISARATCVSSMERLADKFPELKAASEETKKDVSPEVKRLLNNRNHFLKK